MTIFARLLSSLTNRRSIKRLTLACGLAALTAALLATAVPAGAVVTTVGPVTVGVQPRPSNAYKEARKPKTYANPAGNPVLHGASIYAIYWDPTYHYWSEWQSAIDGYFEQAGGDSGALSTVFAVDAQYTDKSNRPAVYSQKFKGAYDDYHAYPTPGCVDPEPFEASDQIGLTLEGAPTPVCLTSAQISSELEAFIAANKLPKGLGTVYYMLTPPGVTVCLDGGKATGHCSNFSKSSPESYENSFCSYHGDINPGGLASGDGNTILYGVIPWTAGGFGDWDLTKEDQRPGWECQDDGVNPSGKGGYELEEHPFEEEPNAKVPCPNTNGDCDYGLSDLIINQISLEQQNIVTDPLLNAWQDEHKNENTDECRFLFGPVRGGSSTYNEETMAGNLYDQSLVNGGNYYLNDAFDLAAERLAFPGVPCLNNVNLDPKFTAPNPVNAGETIGFNGAESDIALDAGFDYSSSGAPQPNYATYTWNFGDGTPEVSGYAPGSPTCETPYLSPCAATVFHSFQYGGTYDVTLTVKDIAGDSTSVEHQVTVNGPARPSSTSSSSGGAGGAAGGSSGSGSGSGSVLPAPVAAAAIARQALRSALRKGLLVSYSVNEQVAGRFEVLLSSAIARKLGISGTLATELPAGTPPQLVIAKAILVTTKAGHSAVHIVFSKRTAARLAHVHKVSLMLRMTVRNAAKSNPLTTTVLSSVTLG